MTNFLFIVSFVAGLLALVICTLERRGASRIPIFTLIHTRFPTLQFREILIGFIAGTIVILGTVGLSASLGWAELGPASAIVGGSLLLGLATVLIKFALAAIEELIFRGAILPQVSKLTSGIVGLIISSLLFAWGHLERSGSNTPNSLSLLVLVFDGIGFGVAYLATKSLWMPTIWHTVKTFGSGCYSARAHYNSLKAYPKSVTLGRFFGLGHPTKPVCST